MAGFKAGKPSPSCFISSWRRSGRKRRKLLPFDKLLGKKVTVEVSSREQQTLLQRHCQPNYPGRDSDEDFTHYRWRWCPKFWLLDRS